MRRWVGLPSRSVVLSSAVWDAVRAAAAYAVFSASFMWPVLAGQYSLSAGGENAGQWLAWYNVAAKAVHQGFLPLWDPFQFGGTTLVGEGQAGVLYPFNLLAFALFGDANGIGGHLIDMGYGVHLMIAATGMYLLLRKQDLTRTAAFVGGLAFGFGGFIAAQGFWHIAVTEGSAWLPWSVLGLQAATEHGSIRLAAIAGLPLALSLLAGHQDGALMTIEVLGVFTLSALLCRRNTSPVSRGQFLACAATQIVFGFAIAAPQVLPLAEYASVANRYYEGGSAPFNVKVPYDVIIRHPFFAPSDLISFVFPYGFGVNEAGTHQGATILVLLIIAFLAARAHQGTRFFSIVLMLGVALIMGPYSAIHGLVYWLTPFADKVRTPSRQTLLVSFAIAGLAAQATDVLSRPLNRPLRHLLGIWARHVAWFVAGMWLIAVGASTYLALATPQRVGAIAWMYASLIPATAAVFLWWLRVSGGLRRSAFAGLLITLVGFELMSYPMAAGQWRQQRTDHPDAMAANHPLFTKSLDLVSALRSLQAASPGARFQNDGDVMEHNYGDALGIREMLGFRASMPLDTEYFRNRASSHTTSLFNRRYLITTKPAVDAAARKVFESGGTYVYEVEGTLGPAWMVYHVSVMPREAALAYVARGEFSPSTEAVVSFDKDPGAVLPKIPVIGPWLSTQGALATALVPPLPAGHGSYSVTEISRQLQQIHFRVTTDAAGLLVISEPFWPGWKITVNGRPAPIARTDFILTGVQLNAGVSDVVFYYDPHSVKGGIVLSITALLALGLMLWVPPATPAMVVWLRRSVRRPSVRRLAMSAARFLGS